MTITEKLRQQLPSFEAACGILNVPADKAVPSFEFFPERDRVAMQKLSELVIIIRAANWIANGGKDWVPDFNDSDENPATWFYMDGLGGSSGFRFYGCDDWGSASSVGSRLCFFDDEVGDYVVDTFFGHYEAFFVIEPSVEGNADNDLFAMGWKPCKWVDARCTCNGKGYSDSGSGCNQTADAKPI